MNDAITIREATVAEARGIARVLVDGWQTTYTGILPATFLASFNYDQHEAGTRELLKSLPSSSAAVFVALEENGAVVGVAYVREAKAGPKDFSAELDAIYVLPSAQRRIIGGRLFRRAVRWLRDRGHASMFLWVLRDNPYRRFYDRLGGEMLNEQKQEDFGEGNVTSVAYGWRDLEALSASLEGVNRPTA
jgi:GNAT superfamily N-acetyltransferase